MATLTVLSSGAGGTAYMTDEAHEALRRAEVVVTYTKYAKELAPLLEGKQLFTSGMTHEIERCKQAIQSALDGYETCIISNGDANVFGMATLIVELIDEADLWDKLELRSVAGVTAFLAAASRIGAPISQDFAVISLSDRLTPIEHIDTRVQKALEGDFVLGIYNPRSKKRIQPYLNFLQRLQAYRERIVIIASNVGRPKERITVTTADALIESGLDHPDITMSTLLIVGNSTTRRTKNGLVLTPRGYLNKYDTEGNLKQ